MSQKLPVELKKQNCQIWRETQNPIFNTLEYTVCWNATYPFQFMCLLQI